MADLPTRALSVRAPWWWAIIHLGKDIENRSRRHSFRGRIWLHASSWYRAAEVRDDMDSVADCFRASGRPPLGVKLTHALLQPAGGCIVGSVEIVDCVEQSASPWFFGPVGFVLRDPVALAKPVPCKGALGFFRLPADVLERLAA